MCVLEGTLVKRKTHILGLHPHNIIVDVSRCQLIDTNLNPEWATSSKTPRFDILSYAIKNIVEKWWVEETKVSLNQKEVCNFRNSRKVYKQHVKHYFLED
jgi:hypothetical protein